MKALRMRGWLGRGNWAIAAGMATLVVARCADPMDPRPALDVDAGDLEHGAAAARPESDGGLSRFLVSVRRFHPEPRPPAPDGAPPGSADNGPLPLIVYRLALYVDSHDGNATAMIRSKDPGRRLTHHLREGVPVDGIVLRRLDVTEGSVTAFVERGSESAALSVDTAHPSSVRIAAAAADPAPPTSASNTPTLALENCLRCVPYFDADGKPAGLRVTGVLVSSPLRKTGLAIGDAIVSVDDEVVTSPATLVSRLRSGWSPTELAVISSGDMKTRRTIRLR